MPETPGAGTVTRTDADGVATLTLLRPGLTSESRRDLLAAVESAGSDPSVRAVLLTGSGRAFSVGQDVIGHVSSGAHATYLNVPTAALVGADTAGGRCFTTGKAL